MGLGQVLVEIQPQELKFACKPRRKQLLLDVLDRGIGLNVSISFRRIIFICLNCAMRLMSCQSGLCG